MLHVPLSSFDELLTSLLLQSHGRDNDDSSTALYKILFIYLMNYFESHKSNTVAWNLRLA